MARQKSATRIVRIAERHGNKYRNRYRVNGVLVLDAFATEGEAVEAARLFEKGQGQEGQTVREVMESWIKERLEANLVDKYHSKTIEGWHGILMEAPITSITEAQMMACHERRKSEDYAVATIQLDLRVNRQLYAWALKKKIIKASPLVNVSEKRKSKKGKVQITTLRELYAFRDVVWKYAYQGDRCALAVLISLYTGARSAEVRDMRGKHVDINNRLVIPGTKSEAAVRAVTLAAPELVRLLEERAAEAGLQGRLVDRSDVALRMAVKRFAKEAQVEHAERLCFHSLRGTVASLATSQIDIAQASVAALLGHSSFDVTAAHYASPSSQAQRATSTRLRVLSGGVSTGSESLNTATKGGKALK